MLQTGDVWNGAEALVVPVGASSEELRYHKSIALQVWLYGYELPGKQRRTGRTAAITCCCTMVPHAHKLTCALMCRYCYAVH